jgi:hypothetical protein
MTEINDAYDSPWKDVLEAYFQDFMQFFFPQIHDEIDWSRGYEFLDQELSQIVRDADLGKRLADKLVKVWKLNGEETWVLLHIEIQNQEESKFNHRMFVYFYRIGDKYDKPIVSLAILGDDNPRWRPKPYETELWGCRVFFEFPYVKLIDYEDRWEELEASRNPFAIVTMAHLKTKATRKDPLARKEWKFRLTRRLYDRGYAKQDILNLYRFLDWILELPEDLKQAFRAELAQYEQEMAMPYITTNEQLAKAEEQLATQSRIALNLMKENLSLEIISRTTGFTIAQLQELQAQSN